MKKIYNLILNDKGRFAVSPRGIVELSAGESGGVRFVFTLPAEWSRYDSVSLEYMNRDDEESRISTLALPAENGKYYYDVAPDFTRATGKMLIQLVGRKADGTRRMTVLDNSPDITVKPSVGATKTLVSDNSVVYNDAAPELLNRIDALTAAINAKADAASVYTKHETDGKIEEVSGFNPEQIYSALERKADASALAAKADKADLAAKADTATVTAQLAGKADVSALAAKADKTDLAAKADTATVTAQLAGKADTAAMNTALATKADASVVYTKAQTDEKINALSGFDATGLLEAIDQKADKTALAAKADTATVSTQLAAKADASAVYTKAQTDTALAAKANTTTINAALAAKADKTEITGIQRADTLWSGSLYPSTVYGQRIKVNLNNFNYNKYKAFEFEFSNFTYKCPQHKSWSGGMVLYDTEIYYEEQEVVPIFISTTVYPDRFEIGNCFYTYISQNTFDISLTYYGNLVSVKGIY